MIEDLVRRHSLLVIHGHNLHHFSVHAALAVDRVRAASGIKVHHTFHETWPDVPRTEPVYRRWDGAYAVSRFVQQDCINRLSFEPELLPLGIDTARFRPRSQIFGEARSPIIFHPARLLPWKGVHVSIDTLRILLGRGYDVRLVLTDTKRIVDWNEEVRSYGKEILRMIAKLKFEPYIRVVQPAYDQMPILYNHADIVVYHTVGEEPYGLVPLEAMSCGRPIIASRSEGIVETVVDGSTGYIVEKNNPEALAEKVAKVLNDRAEARRLGDSGRRQVEGNSSAQTYTSELLRRYASAANPDPAHR